MAMMEQAPRQVAVKISPVGDRMITSGAHYLHMSKKDLVEAAVALPQDLVGILSHYCRDLRGTPIDWDIRLW